MKRGRWFIGSLIAVVMTLTIAGGAVLAQESGGMAIHH